MDNLLIKMKILITALAFTSLAGCASKATLGTKDHVFSDKGKHIIWLQIEGLLPEHLPLLKYTQEKATDHISFERMACTGTTWAHNLYDIRPRPQLGFVSQILGSQNVQGQCSDVDRRPVWNYFQQKGYEVAVMESAAMGNKSLNEYGKCSDNVDIFEGVHFWRREKVPATSDAKFFHYLEDRTGMSQAGTYYDKSCQDKGCFVSLITNLKSMWKNFKLKHAKTFTVVRDIRFIEQLNKGDINSALEVLRSWDKYLDEIIDQAEGKSVTILVTSTAGRAIEFPLKGSQWSDFESKGKSILYKRQSLTAGAWAYGPGSENFCGIYEEDQIFSRLLWAPEKTLLDQFIF